MNGTIDPSTLRITDMRFADIDGAPKRCTLIKLYTNQGLIGYGELQKPVDYVLFCPDLPKLPKLPEPAEEAVP